MVSAFVLLKVERHKIDGVAGQLAEMPNISEVYSVAGQHDLIAVIRAKNNEELAELVTGKLLQVDGILSSETNIAFRVYSRYDLDRVFSLGTEG